MTIGVLPLSPHAAMAVFRDLNIEKLKDVRCLLQSPTATEIQVGSMINFSDALLNLGAQMSAPETRADIWKFDGVPVRVNTRLRNNFALIMKDGKIVKIFDLDEPK